MSKNRKRIVWLTVILLTLSLGCALTGRAVAKWGMSHTENFVYEFEQAATALKTAPSNPEQAITKAQKHLAAARTELEILRPVADPVMAQANRISNLPLIGTPAKQLSSLWSFANATTSLTEEMVNAGQISLNAYNQDGVTGVVNITPTIQKLMQKAETNFTVAQQARVNLDTIYWLPADTNIKLRNGLNDWDKTAPLMRLLLVETNQLLDQIDIKKSWEQAQILTEEVQQVANILETANKDQATAIQQARPHLAAARISFEALRPDMEILLEHLRKLDTSPDVELPEQMAELPKQIEAWWQFADALMMLSKDMSGAVELALFNMKEEGITGLIAAIPTMLDHFQAAETHFSQAQTARVQLKSVSWLPDYLAIPLNDALTNWDNISPVLEKSVSDAGQIIRIMPFLLGNKKPVNYLLLVQSTDELRSTGGFIGGIGVVKIEKGKITDILLKEVTEFDNNPTLAEGEFTQWTTPPDPIKRYLGIGHWYLRDANWWADFPSVARLTTEFWYVENDIQIDGVIGITDQSLQSLLKSMGPVKTMDGQVINADNAKDFAAERIYRDGAGGATKQSIVLQELALVFVNLTKDISLERSLQLGKYLREAAARHDLLVSSFDPPIASVLNDIGIDGALKGQQDDYFYLVESNVSYNKLSPFIQQDLTYEATLGADAWPTIATLTVDETNKYSPNPTTDIYPDSYYNGGRWNPFTRKVDTWTGYYGGYTRLYATPGSEFIAATGFDDGPDIKTENRRQFIGGYVNLLPDETQQIKYQWTPAGKPSQPGRYQLFVQRQSGAPEHALNVIVNIPAGYKAVNISPPPIIMNEEKISWYASLDRDQRFSLMLESEGSITTTTPTNTAIINPSPISSTVAISSSKQTTTPAPIAAAPASEFGRAQKTVWLNIPNIGVGAPVISVGLEPSGIMASPEEADIVGWYELGPRPGEPSNAILAGHVDWNGEIGVFSRLHELKPGDTIEAQTGPDNSYNYVVESIISYQADTAPVAEIFGATRGATLTLITCGGEYDYLRQEYRDRIVVRARGVK